MIVKNGKCFDTGVGKISGAKTIHLQHATAKQDPSHGHHLL
jgi:hypothetical protein